jgi:hypothetical protein
MSRQRLIVRAGRAKLLTLSVLVACTDSWIPRPTGDPPVAPDGGGAPTCAGAESGAGGAPMGGAGTLINVKGLPPVRYAGMDPGISDTSGDGSPSGEAGQEDTLDPPVLSLPACLSGLDRTCVVDADCIVVTLCERVIGIRASEASRFDAAAKQCQAGAEGAACAALDDGLGNAFGPSVTTDDGNSPEPGQDVVAACLQGACESVIQGGVFCGEPGSGPRCAEGERCCFSPDACGNCAFTCAASCPGEASPCITQAY